MTVLTGITAAAAVIKVAIDLTPDVIRTIEDAKPFAEKIFAIFGGSSITDAELDKMMEDAKALHSSIQGVDASDPPAST